MKSLSVKKLVFRRRKNLLLHKMSKQAIKTNHQHVYDWIINASLTSEKSQSLLMCPLKNVIYQPSNLITVSMTSKVTYYTSSKPTYSVQTCDNWKDCILMILQKVKRLVDNTQLVKFIFMSQKHKRFGHISYKVWKEERQNGEKHNINVVIIVCLVLAKRRI